MAAGDILAASTTNSAGQAYFDVTSMIALKIAGVAAGGTHDTGIPYNIAAASTTLDVSAAKIVVTVTSVGNDAAGNATTYQRTLYGTVSGRKPYPNQTTKNEVVSGSDLWVSYWLSDTIYASDTNITVNVLAGLYTKSGVPSAATTAMTVTNASTAAYPLMTGRWLNADRNLAVTTWTERFIGFSKYAYNHAPAAFAYCVASDTHGHSVTVNATLVQVTASQGHPYCAYECTFNASSFTQDDVITVDFFLVPWIGATTITSSSLTNVTSHLVQCDKNDSWTTHAAVSPTGNNGTGAVSTTEAGARATPYLTITEARKQIRLYNNSNKSRNNACGGIIHCEAGTYVSASTSTFTLSAAETAFCTVKPCTGVTAAQVIITNVASLDGCCDGYLVCYEGVTVRQTVDAIYFYIYDAAQRIWIKDAIWEGFQDGSNGNGVFFGTGAANVYVTNTVLTNNNTNAYWPAQFFVGNYGTEMTRISNAGTVVGCVLVSHVGDASDFCSAVENAVVYNTSFLRMGRLAISFGDFTYGATLVQCELEKLSGSAQPIMASAATGTGTGTTNFGMFKCTLAGDRVNVLYYGSSAPTVITGSSFKDNLISGIANKSDTFVSDGTQYGNWQVVNGVGFSGNYIRQWTGTANSFGLEFMGLGSVFAYDTVFQSESIIFYQLDNSQFGANVGAGNFYLQPKSPARVGFTETWPGLPFDIDGNPRNFYDPPGARCFKAQFSHKALNIARR